VPAHVCARIGTVCTTFFHRAEGGDGRGRTDGEDQFLRASDSGSLERKGPVELPTTATIYFDSEDRVRSVI